MNKYVDNIRTSLDNPFHRYMLEIDETYTEAGILVIINSMVYVMSMGKM